MKKIVPLFVFVFALLAFVRCAAPKNDLSGYYILSNPRSESNAMYVGQVKMPLGYVNSDANDFALHACWERFWTFPDVPTSDVARYIFRIERARSTRRLKRQPNEYTIQNLGYGRYLMLPYYIYHAVETSTVPEETFLIAPSDSLSGYYTLQGTKKVHSFYTYSKDAEHEGSTYKQTCTISDADTLLGRQLLENGFTITSGDQIYLHASNDINSIVRWSSDEHASHWRLTPIDKAYARDAYEIFNPKAETSEIPLPQGHICEAPDAAPEHVLDSIVSRYHGTPLAVFMWNGEDTDLSEWAEHMRGTLKLINDLGGKSIFITDETTSVYDWLNLVKSIGGDHYRVPRLHVQEIDGPHISAESAETGETILEPCPVFWNYIFDAEGRSIYANAASANGEWYNYSNRDIIVIFDMLSSRKRQKK